MSMANIGPAWWAYQKVNTNYLERATQGTSAVKSCLGAARFLYISLIAQPNTHDVSSPTL